MNDSTDAVVIERVVNAPVDIVWKMWTEPDHFAQWYGPKGASVPTAKMDVVVGGSRLICMEMQTPKGLMQMWFAGEYLEVVPATRLVYTELMADDQGNAKPADQLPPGHPGTTKVIVELAAEEGKTRMTMTHVGVPADSPGAMGWNMAFDKLEDLLAAQ